MNTPKEVEKLLGHRDIKSALLSISARNDLSINEKIELKLALDSELMRISGAIAKGHISFFDHTKSPGMDEKFKRKYTYAELDRLLAGCSELRFDPCRRLGIKMMLEVNGVLKVR
jgi:hypothetical protein